MKINSAIESAITLSLSMQQDTSGSTNGSRGSSSRSTSAGICSIGNDGSHGGVCGSSGTRIVTNKSMRS